MNEWMYVVLLPTQNSPSNEDVNGYQLIKKVKQRQAQKIKTFQQARNQKLFYYSSKMFVFQKYKWFVSGRGVILGKGEVKHVGNAKIFSLKCYLAENYRACNCIHDVRWWVIRWRSGSLGPFDLVAGKERGHQCHLVAHWIFWFWWIIGPPSQNDDQWISPQLL